MPISWPRPPANSCSAKRRRASAPGSKSGLTAIPRFKSLPPTRLRGWRSHSLDLIVMHSVAQYLTAAGTGALFALFHRLLKPGGLLVVSDVISPEVVAATDAWALLRFGQANGFFLAALWGLLRTLLSDYWRLRSRIGLTRYAEAAMIEKLGAAGFAAECAPANIGQNQARKTYYARPPDHARPRPQDPVGSFPCPPFLVRLPDAHSRPSPVLVDELDAGSSQRRKTPGHMPASIASSRSPWRLCGRLLSQHVLL